MENILHLAGGLFLFYLAFGAYRSYKNYSYDQTTVLKSANQNFLKAVMVNLLNPNPFLEWSLIMGPLLLKGWREAPANGIALVSGFYGAIIICSSAIILMFSAIRRIGPGLSRILIAVSAVALAGFGIYQLWLGISGLAASPSFG
jgi:threonine/homoserine/homoserine lactone efflux protein